MHSKIKGMRIAGIASAAPTQVRTPEETAAPMDLPTEEIAKIVKMTGVKSRRVAPKEVCLSDLAFAAADRLLNELQWDRSTVDGLVLVTQGPDYLLPATSCLLQHRLGLPKTCAAIDITLGCSGYIYGLWTCAGMMANGARRILLLAGDTSDRGSSPYDRSTVFIFGDAGTATALEADASAPPMDHILGTDGSGGPYLMVPGGGSRNRLTSSSFERTEGPDGILRAQDELFMDGAQVFEFTLRELPPLFESILAASGWTLADVDAVVPHQANLFMLKTVSKVLRIPSAKLVISLDEFGNTSSASIPLAMSHRLADRLRREPMRLLLAGFGVGWSWGAIAATVGPLVMPDIVYV